VQIDSHNPECKTSANQFVKLPNLVNLENSSPITMVLHISEIHRPNFKENRRIFKIIVNGQAFLQRKMRRGERWVEKEIGINMKIKC